MLNLRATEEEDKSIDDVIQWYSRLHCLVVGPGLGREEGMMQLVKVYCSYLSIMGEDDDF